MKLKPKYRGTVTVPFRQASFSEVNSKRNDIDKDLSMMFLTDIRTRSLSLTSKRRLG